MRGKGLLSEFLLFLIFLKDVSGLKIRNKLLGKCLQVQEGATGGQASLGECRPDSSVQEWRWLPKVQALSSLHTGECLTPPTEEHEGVVLRPCIFKDGAGGEDVEREARGQAWTCTKKGHITLTENRLHLSASKDSTLVFLLREHKQGSKWRALHNQTLCNGRDAEENPNRPYHHVEGKKTNISESPLPERHMQVKTYEGILDSKWTEASSVKDVTIPSSLITKSPADPSIVFFAMDYGMGWKISMLVLSSVALVLGAIILILNVYSNRRRKVVCVLKSYTPTTPEMSIPGSPASNERAALTEHAMHFPHSSPSLPRGEILIEWKDGTVTPLYEA